MKTAIILLALSLVTSFGIEADAPASADNPAASKSNLRLVAVNYQGDLGKADPKSLKFVVIGRDVPQPAQFLQLEDNVPNTRFKLTKFEFKTRPRTDGRDGDVSELTLVHTETKKAVVLTLGTPSTHP